VGFGGFFVGWLGGGGGGGGGVGGVFFGGGVWCVFLGLVGWGNSADRRDALGPSHPLRFRLPFPRF